MKKRWNIGWGTVSACNMNCRFCYSRFRRKDSRDLGLEDWIAFVDRNADYIHTINYGTGENSLSEDWFTLISYVRRRYPRIRQALTTNGYVSEAMRRDPEKEAIVKEAIDEMDISLDFADAEKHNAFRGQPHAYQWAMDTLAFCRDHHKQATIVCLGSGVNAYPENLDGIFGIARRYGAMVRMNLYRPTEGIDDFSREFILEPERLVELLRWIGANHTVLSISDALYSNLLTNRAEEDPSGIDSLRILPDGGVTPSTYLIREDFIVGNIREGEILKRLTEEPVLQELIHEVIPEECRGCRYVGNCRGGVYDRRYLWNQTLEKKDPYCRYQPGDPEWEKIPVSEGEFHSVHHGYLPTMFFLPGRPGEEGV